MRVLFLTRGDRVWASSRMRSYWPADLWDEADAMQFDPDGTIPGNYDVYVWMKTGHLEAMTWLREHGRLNIVEVCDPNWWFEPEFTRELFNRADALVGATEAALADALAWYDRDIPHWFIPDRLNLDHFPRQRVHQDVDPVRFVWYGIAFNRPSLFAALAPLDRLAANGVHLELTIYDDQPKQHWALTEKFAIYHGLWQLELENEVIASHDVAVLPPYPGPWGALKSNNKTLTAWACGLPVTDAADYAELERLATDTDYRAAMAFEGYSLLLDQYQIRHTVEDWQQVIRGMTNGIHARDNGQPVEIPAHS